MPFDPSEEMDNPKVEFINLATSFVNNEYFKNNDTRLYFFSIVNDTFTKILKIYCNKMGISERDILFIYKGGNILRIIYTSYIKKLPKCSRDILKKDFDDNFKKSDMDFNISINPSLPNFSKVHEDVRTITLLTLNLIRGYIGKESYFVTDYYKYIVVEKKRLLDKLLDDMSNASALKDSKSPYFNFKAVGLQLDDLSVGTVVIGSTPFKRDLIIKRDKNIELTTDTLTYEVDKLSDEKMLYSDQNNNNSFKILKEFLNLMTQYKDFNDKFMYASFNDALMFLTKNGLEIKFDLLRIKTNIKLTLTSPTNELEAMNLGGEMIDIGISYPDDNLKHFFENIRDKLHIYKYDPPQIAAQREFPSTGNFIGYNLKYAIEDLERILFKVAKFPWDDNKYEKRLKRVVFLYYMSLLGDLKNISEVRKVIENVIKIFENNANIKINEKYDFSRLIKENQRLKDMNKDEIEYQKFKGITSGLLKIIMKSITIIESEEKFAISKDKSYINVQTDKADMVGGCNCIGNECNCGYNMDDSEYGDIWY